FGTTTTGTYIESAAGIEEGGRSGFTAVVTALCFLGLLFFGPLAKMVPAFAYGPALIMVGILMMGAVTRINFDDMTELIPAFATIVLMSFTYNIGIGMTAGFVLYPLMKVITGRVQEVPTGMWVLSALSLAFFAFYPY
ncbi:MAG: NCS2 family permease, partial [Planctomycetes bacterium]|nr:NCS2 family permease [Planctomycetota bacterium]